MVVLYANVIGHNKLRATRILPVPFVPWSSRHLHEKSQDFTLISQFLTGIFSVFHKTAHIFVTLSKPSSLVRQGIRCGFWEHLGNFLIGLWISWSDMRHRQSALISLSFTGAQVHTNNTRGKWSKMTTNAPVYARKESCGEIWIPPAKKTFFSEKRIF